MDPTARVLQLTNTAFSMGDPNPSLAAFYATYENVNQDGTPGVFFRNYRPVEAYVFDSVLELPGSRPVNLVIENV